MISHIGEIVRSCQPGIATNSALGIAIPTWPKVRDSEGVGRQPAVDEAAVVRADHHAGRGARLVHGVARRRAHRDLAPAPGRGRRKLLALGYDPATPLTMRQARVRRRGQARAREREQIADLRNENPAACAGRRGSRRIFTEPRKRREPKCQTASGLVQWDLSDRRERKSIREEKEKRNDPVHTRPPGAREEGPDDRTGGAAPERLEGQRRGASPSPTSPIRSILRPTAWLRKASPAPALRCSRSS